MLRFSPAGIAVIDPDRVVTQGWKAEWYEVMPQGFGLAQLMDQGVIVREGGSDVAPVYRIVKPMARFPAGLCGAHRVDFILSAGVPMPAGNPCHSGIRQK